MKTLISSLLEDKKIKELIEVANTMCVKRLLYNDHGIVHAGIVARNALLLYELLFPLAEEKGWPTCKDNHLTYEDGRRIVAIASVLHDVGNAIHRENHEFFSVILAEDIIDRLLAKERKKEKMKVEILHAIYSHEKAKAITLEASCVKIGDALDMTEGRARIPEREGRFSIHSASASSITKVEIRKGKEKAVEIEIEMKDRAGIFQIDELLIPRIQNSCVRGEIKIIVKTNEKEYILFP